MKYNTDSSDLSTITKYEFIYGNTDSLAIYVFVERYKIHLVVSITLYEYRKAGNGKVVTNIILTLLLRFSKSF